MSTHHARRAARALATAGKRKAAASPLVRGADWRTATVATVGTDNTITTADGIPCRRMAAYDHPVVGDQIVISRSGAGNWRAEGRLMRATDTEWASYTPTVANAGSAAWSTRDGWWKRTGSLVHFTAFLGASAVGSGSGNITISLPSTPYRGSSNRRQMIPCYAGGLGTGAGTGCGLVTAGGSGAVMDQIRNSANGLVTGADIATSTIFTITGSYREA